MGETRRLVRLVQASPQIDDEKRVALGITVPDADPTPIGPPTAMPVLRIKSVSGRLFDLEVLNADGKRRKPAGVRGAWLYAHVGENPPTNLTAWQFKGGSTKYNPQVAFDESVAAGTVVYLTALWVNPKDQPGPACAPVKSHVNFAGLNQAA